MTKYKVVKLRPTFANVSSLKIQHKINQMARRGWNLVDQETVRKTFGGTKFVQLTFARDE